MRSYHLPGSLCVAEVCWLQTDSLIYDDDDDDGDDDATKNKLTTTTTVTVTAMTVIVVIIIPESLNDRWKRLCLVSWAAAPCVWTLRVLTRNLLTYLLIYFAATSCSSIFVWKLQYTFLTPGARFSKNLTTNWWKTTYKKIRRMKNLRRACDLQNILQKNYDEVMHNLW